MAPPHPQEQELLAFLNGRLNAEGIAHVESHIRECQLCCDTLQSLGDDTFIDLLKSRSVSSADTPTLIHPLSAVREVPRELRDHVRYRIMDPIGHGGMGTVYRAEHRLMNRIVAIKVINSGLVTNPLAVERFRREVQAAAKLSHPNIVTAYDAEQADSLQLLVMEYVDGKDLATVVKERGPLSPESACDYVTQAAFGLQHAHEKGMVHRDIKPHNLMLTTDGQIRILDFGLSGLVRGVQEEASVSDLSNHPEAGQITAAGALMGTPDYMAPEQAIDAHATDIRADIYSLGCTFYFLLTGHPPFVSGSAMERIRAHAESTPALVHELDHRIPKQLSTIVARMMERSLDKRFQSPDEVIAALSEYLNRSHRNSRWRSRKSIAVATGGLMVLAVFLGLIYVRMDSGTLVVETADEEVRVALGKTGVVIRDDQSGKSYRVAPGKQSLKSGKYHIDVTELPDGLRFSTNEFTVSRGDVRRVQVQWVPNRDPAESTRASKQSDTGSPAADAPGAEPDSELSELELTPDAQSAVKAARDFLGLIDADDPVQAFDSMSALAHRFAERTQFGIVHRATTKQYGKLKSRKLKKAYAVLPIPGLPPGDYFTVQFRSDFEQQSGHWEFVMLDRDADGQWRANAHGIAPQPPSLRPRPNDGEP